MALTDDEMYMVEGIRENLTFVASMLALGIFALKELYGRDRELVLELKKVVEDNTKVMQAIDKRVSILEYRAGVDRD